MKDKVLAKIAEVNVSAVVEHPVTGFARQLSVTELGLVSGGQSATRFTERTVSGSAGDGGYGDDCVD